MAVYLDPPRWPAHGTMFSHLISNQSLEELHSFAATAGIPERAFDRDHYDVPMRRRAELIALGAIPVEGSELTRLLIASGLRVPARLRSESLETALSLRWRALLPGTDDIAAELLERWAEPHRHYHSRTHLLAVLEALELITAELPRTVLLAAWFHDAVYQGVAGQDEEDSARLAEILLSPHLPGNEVAEVARLVRLTVHHDPKPTDHNGALLCDADLAVLGGSAEEYARYRRAVRQDYADIAESDFRRGRAAVLQQLLALKPLYHTEQARQLWGDQAVSNLSEELAELSNPQA
ncbi:DUF4031 domain-containing protein [Psychromicrobium lacuslunae]|uniref:DUF4031 domain-containing protein n=1 Tax=Psychromicrobium lacuslunae TaxID=1618207 RepID=A0A0D4C0U2_9MICC|nr:DUF4031 domain-containing protein [Psychromicrobium lacuslunae]AJT41986.1 hypothetical protein UM93_11550 [Psychromicrobium lacuslunae]